MRLVKKIIPALCLIASVIGKRYTEKNAEKVPIKIYYESLCPGCLAFLTNSLRKTITRDNWEQILDIELIPFGLASIKEENGKEKMSCQHGEEECKGNKYHMCILELGHLMNKNEQLNLITCASIKIMAGLFMRDAELGDFTWNKAVKNCSKMIADDFKIKIDLWKHIKGCFDADDIDMVKKYQRKSDKENIMWSPFITAFGTYSRRYEDEIKDNMYAFGCKYFGGSLPNECRNVSLKLPIREYKDYADKDIHGEAREILFGENNKKEKHCKDGKCRRKLPKGYKIAKKIQGTRRVKSKGLKNYKEEQSD